MVEPGVQVIRQGEFRDFEVLEVVRGDVPVNIIPIWDGVMGNGEGEVNSCAW
jgi:hypothetical protein